MKKNLSNIILVLVFITGLSLLLYPTVSDWWNSMHSSQAIVNYTEIVAQIDNTRYEEIWQQANEYNQALARKKYQWVLTKNEKKDYYSQMNVSNTGIIGYIEIPAISVKIPIYLGTSDDVLAVGIGHIEGSSLPVGGESTHSVLSGHRGLPSAKLFTDLDRLVVGDTFLIKILDEVLTYEVDQILIVLPHEMDALEIEEGKDLCTLVTCTPYGINSHRLLVRGHRIETEEVVNIRVPADAVQIEPYIVAPIVAVPMIIILLIVLLATPVKKGGIYEE
ncbi:MAG: class C sortase [Oscillospiraceae bacterium]|nr:class C sortase [Oscillospiraceae bacterium]